MMKYSPQKIKGEKISSRSHLPLAHTLECNSQLILSPCPWISFICSGALQMTFSFGTPPSNAKPDLCLFRLTWF